MTFRNPCLLRRGGVRELLFGALTPLVVCCFGCPLPTPSDSTSDANNPQALPALDKGGNNSISTATILTFDSNGEVRYTGAIDGATDIDVYALGDVQPGDEVYIDVRRTSGDLDAVAGLFDSRNYLIAFNDDRVPDGSNLDPLIGIVLPANAGNYYLGIVAYPDLPTTGNYEVTVQIQRNVGVPKAQGQTVFLNWAGGNHVVIPNVGQYDLTPFSAVDVGLTSADTVAVKQGVQQVVEERYKNFDLIVLNSDNAPEPTTPHSTVYFGGADVRAFAISQQIDTFNADQTDKTIIYVQSFQGAFATMPTRDELIQALGNTTAHEIGHLLGLVHTHDCDDLMDTSCFNDRLLSPQDYKTAAPLDFSVFPFGYQAAKEILTWLLGPVAM
jgi:hypothetical protein